MPHHHVIGRPSTIDAAADIDKTVAEVDTDMTDVAQGGRGDRHSGAGSLPAHYRVATALDSS